MSDEPRAVVDLSHARRFGVHQLLLCIGLTAAILLVLLGPSIRASGEKMDDGIIKTSVLAVGEPAGWLGDRLPFHDATQDATAWLSPDEDLGDEGGFETVATPLEGANGSSIPPVTADAFSRAELGEPVRKRPLQKVLVTGDSLSQPLDAELARRFADAGVEVKRDAHLGTGISKTDLLDWGKLSTRQAKEEHDAVVMFIGANEGFPLPGPDGKDIDCCTAEWAASYANRARAMMNAYRRAGEGRIYWLTLPTPRDPDRAKIARVVNQAIVAAAAPYRAQVRIIDTVELFSPGFKYRDSMPVNGRDTIVRESDGIHLNGDGSKLLADRLVPVMQGDFTW